MALNGLLDIELSVPDPAALAAFWERRGLIRTADDVLGTADRPVQLRVAEGTYRHLSLLHLSCEAEADLAVIAGRIGDHHRTLHRQHIRNHKVRRFPLASRRYQRQIPKRLRRRQAAPGREHETGVL